MIKKSFAIIVISLVFLCSSCVYFPSYIKKQYESDSLHRYSIFAYEDVLKKNSVSDIAQIPLKNLQKIDKNYSPGFLQGNFYLVIELFQNNNFPYVLSFGPELFDVAELYVFNAEQGTYLLADSNGRMVKNENKKIVSWRTALLVPENNQKIIVKITNQDATSLQLQLASLEDFYRQTEKLSRMHTLFFTIMIFTIAFLIFLRVIQNEQYITYLVFISISFLCYSLTMKGIGATYIWNTFVHYSFFSRLGYIFACCGLYCSLKIYFSTVEIHQNKKQIQVIFKIFALVACLSIFIYGFMDNLHKAYVITIFLLIVGCLISAFYGIKAAKSTFKTKAIFTKLQLVIAWIPLFFYIIFRQTFHLFRLQFSIPFIEQLFENDYYFGYDFCFLCNVIACVFYVLTNMYKQYKELTRRKEIEKFYMLVVDDIQKPIFDIKNSVKDFYLKKDIPPAVYQIEENCRKLETICQCFVYLDGTNPNRLDFIKNEPIHLINLCKKIFQQYIAFFKNKNILFDFVYDFEESLHFFGYEPFLNLLLEKLMFISSQYSLPNNPFKFAMTYDKTLKKLELNLKIFGGGGGVQNDCNTKEYTHIQSSFFLIDKIASIYEGSRKLVITEKKEICITIVLELSCLYKEPIYIETDTIFQNSIENMCFQKILIVESDVKTLNVLLRIFSEYEIISVPTVLEAKEKVNKWLPDIIIQSINGDDKSFNFFNFCEETESLKHIPFIFLTDSKCNKHFLETIWRKNIFYFKKPFNGEDLFFTVKKIFSMYDLIRNHYMQKLSNLLLYPSEVKKESLEERYSFYQNKELSRREIEITELLLQGKDSKAIAGHLYISANTVATHIRHIYAKLEVKNKIQLFQLLKNK